VQKAVCRARAANKAFRPTCGSEKQKRQQSCWRHGILEPNDTKTLLYTRSNYSVKEKANGSRFLAFGRLLGVQCHSSVPNWEGGGLFVVIRLVASVRSARLAFMLFMVIERFKNGSTKLIGERFARDGRMLPRALRIM
jgi:hypothetical protein